MGDWNLLGGILEEVHSHSTIVGKIWLTILFIFRMLVLGVAAEEVWEDEQSSFACNTQQPGCNNICYDGAFPISLIRFWVLQIIFVSSPSLVYMGHALYRLRDFEKQRQRKKLYLRAQMENPELDLEEQQRVERELRRLEERKRIHKVPLKGCLLRTYVLHILTRSVLEVGFMIGQYILYGFQMNPIYKCTRQPCPNAVDCFVSRPTEKTIFMLFMHSIAAISLFLNTLEIFHLGIRKIMRALDGKSSSGNTENEIGPPFHPTNYSGTQECMVCSSLPERISLPQANNKQQVIRVNIPRSKSMWKIPYPRQLEVDVSCGTKDWAEKVENSGQLHVHSPCPQDRSARIQHPGQQPCHSIFGPKNVMSQSWLGTMTASQHRPSSVLETRERSQGPEVSGKPLTDRQSHFQGSDSSARESGVWIDRLGPGSRKASFLSRLMSEKGQQHSDSGSSRSLNSSCLDFPHGENSPSPLPSATGHRASMVSKSSHVDPPPYSSPFIVKERRPEREINL